MGIFLKQHDDLFFNVLNAFDNVNPISFKYKGNGIYDLPRASSVDEFNIYTEYAIVEFKKDTLIVKSLEDENIKEIDFHTLDLVELINLYEYINEYIIQSN